MYSDACWQHALRCANSARPVFNHRPLQLAFQRRRHLHTSGTTPSYNYQIDDTVTSPYISQSHKYSHEYEQAVSLTSRIYQLGGAELKSERLRVSQEIGCAEPCTDKHTTLERLVNKFQERIQSQVLTDNTEINDVVKYVLTGQSKLFRPKLGLMVARLLSMRNTHGENTTSADEGSTLGYMNYGNLSTELMDKVLRLLQSYEIVHIGSLMHDDVLDSANLRRRMPAVHVKAGVKIAVLVGDLMLTRACSTVANLGSQVLTVRMSKALENLIKGEITTVEGTDNVESMMCNYLKKTFLKTASLIAECCASIASLLRQDEITCHKCYLLGLHVGMAFQIYDDLLDYECGSSDLGKPTLNDLSSGLITMPLLMALPESPGLGVLVTNGTVQSGNVDSVLPYVTCSQAYERSRYAVMMHLAEVSRILKGMEGNKTSPDSPLSDLSQSLLRFVYDTLTRLKG
ncbi:Polyprenyl synthetase family protein [Babesia bovis T2Bo]|uniref:Polyprenyl synthetase superfamily protein n=1 Tax=Babesia bovis TaxID=5865 RepID=A7ARB8_BABBO|nr:Polyprenyl synthetase family protein [Babesia bovis T2Bo]EDO07087.1 Polyprenyl synthetase family protein [Babesia bovis T2Bo]|eukprot:XP_001610655.1 polyprenyl synthetase superfamily protein [Babesia bovis T2Bo]